MTSPSPSVDPVRERLQQISNEWAKHDDGGTPALIAAIEAVLDLCDFMQGDARSYATKECGKQTRLAIAAGLGVTP